jgi:hypothetical protein
MSANSNTQSGFVAQPKASRPKPEVYDAVVIRPRYWDSNVPSAWYVFTGEQPRVPSAAQQYVIALASEFEAIRDQVRYCGDLPYGWDSYRAGPMSPVAIQNALLAVDSLEKLGVKPSRVAPTSDGSILIRYFREGRRFEWEFYSDGENLRVEIDQCGNETYLEVSSDEISQLL